MNEIISAAVLLILIMDPLGNLPIFMSVLKHTEPKRRRAIMVRELLIALLVMLVFLFAGEKILAFLSLRAETVSMLMLLSHQYPNQMGHLVIALLLAWGGTFVILLQSSLFLRLLGEKGVNALERLMGLILVMMATQMFLDGIRMWMKG